MFKHVQKKIKSFQKHFKNIPKTFEKRPCPSLCLRTSSLQRLLQALEADRRCKASSEALPPFLGVGGWRNGGRRRGWELRVFCEFGSFGWKDDFTGWMDVEFSPGIFRTWRDEIFGDWDHRCHSQCSCRELQSTCIPASTTLLEKLAALKAIKI